MLKSNEIQFIQVKVQNGLIPKLEKVAISSDLSVLAGLPGLEPRYTESESVVLPLNYSPRVSSL